MEIDEEYISIKETRKILGVTTETLRQWNKTGKVRAVKSPSGRRLYNKKDIYNIANRNLPNKQIRKIAYCRVSSKKQNDDLERQKDFFRHKFPDYELVTDIGSGLNWKRKGLKSILERAMSKTISEVVVAHRDRICRFSFELIEFIFKQNGVKLTVLSEDNHKDGKMSDTELTEDIMSIIHVYSCRQIGKRRYTIKDKEI